MKEFKGLKKSILNTDYNIEVIYSTYVLYISLFALNVFLNLNLQKVRLLIIPLETSGHYVFFFFRDDLPISK